MKLNNILSADKKMATIIDLRSLIYGTKVQIYFRSKKELVNGTITSVPKKFTYITHMTNDDFFMVDTEIGELKITKHVYVNNIATLCTKIDGTNQPINFVVSRETSKTFHKNSVSIPKGKENSEIKDVPVITVPQEDLMGLPKENYFPNNPIIDVTPMPAKSVVLYRHVTLDLCGNFQESMVLAPDVPMENLSKKIVACHAMSGSLEWLKDYIKKIESGVAAPINEFHKKRM